MFPWLHGGKIIFLEFSKSGTQIKGGQNMVSTNQPQGFSIKGKEYLSWKLKKSIYELKQASWKWYLKFNDTSKAFGFKENTIDWCIYLKVSGSKFIILIFHVDDILHASNDLGLLRETKKILSKNFKMKDMGELWHKLSYGPSGRM